MDLKTYLDENNISNLQFSLLIGFSKSDKASAVTRWVNKKFKPNKKNMQKIYEVTNGLVTPDSFILNNNDTKEKLRKSKELKVLRKLYEKYQSDAPYKVLAEVLRNGRKKAPSLATVYNKLNIEGRATDDDIKSLFTYYEKTYSENIKELMEQI